MQFEKEENLFNQSFREPPIYIFLHNQKYSLIHLLSPHKIKILHSSNNLPDIVETANQINKSEGFPFIKNTIFTI